MLLPLKWEFPLLCQFYNREVSSIFYGTKVVHFWRIFDILLVNFWLIFVDIIIAQIYYKLGIIVGASMTYKWHISNSCKIIFCCCEYGMKLMFLLTGFRHMLPWHKCVIWWSLFWQTCILWFVSGILLTCYSTFLTQL